MRTKHEVLGRAMAFAALAGLQISCSEPSSGIPDTTIDAQAALNRGQLKILKISGDDQEGVVDTVLRDSIVIQVRDKKGGIGGQTVRWTVKRGGGSVSPISSTTDAAGYAKTAWKMGSAAGTGALDAVASDGGTATFTATATMPVDISPGSVDRVVVSPGSVTLSPVGAQTVLAATAYDANGQAINGQSFYWSSRNTSVATVDGAGRVTTWSAGTALIMVLAGAVADTAIITVTTGTADAATYFVATTGSDANSGTQNAPWRTIGTSLGRLRPGETLYVRGGTYAENIRNPVIQPGRSDARIRVAAYAGERPVIQGLLWLNRPSYWTIDGINVTWSTANGPEDHMVRITNGVGWAFENAELWGARSFAGLLVFGSISGEPANWVIRGNCVRDTRTSPIHHINGDHNLYINTGTSAGAGLIERNILFNAPNGQNVKLGYGRSDVQPGDGAANVTVRYNTMYNSLKNVMVADDSRNNIIERNIIKKSEEGYAIRAYRLKGTGNIFRNNVFHEFSYLQYGDPGYGLVTDGGGILFPLDPQFDGTGGCSDFNPLNTTARNYGRWAQ
jgi:hypothetical protein